MVGNDCTRWQKLHVVVLCLLLLLSSLKQCDGRGLAGRLTISCMHVPLLGRGLPFHPRGTCRCHGYLYSLAHTAWNFYLNLACLSFLFYLSGASIQPLFLCHYISLGIHFNHWHPCDGRRESPVSDLWGLWDSSQVMQLYWPRKGTGPSNGAQPRPHSSVLQGRAEERGQRSSVSCVTHQ